MKGFARHKTDDTRLDRAVTFIRRFPLRWSDGDGDKTVESVLARGWFLGADECARVLAAETGLETGEGGGFGTRWPFLRSGPWTVAPALPVAVGGETAAGVDGEYRSDSAAVWREAGGAEALFLASDLSQPAPGGPFDLLWFGDFERFTVRNRTLEIEDLFGVLRIPASQQILERLLVRSRRVAPEALFDVPAADQSGPQTIEVRRSEDLSRDDRWRDASAFLASRADVEGATTRGAVVEAQLVGGATATFGCDEDESGWLLTLREGSYVFTQIRVARHDKTLGLLVTLDREIDAMAPGMRGRLIFDLRADLVTLG